MFHIIIYHTCDMFHIRGCCYCRRRCCCCCCCRRSHPPPNIAVMKVDVQGYEVLLLQGARALLEARAIKVIKTELAGKWLAAQGSSVRAYCAALAAHGFTLYGEGGGTGTGKLPCLWAESRHVCTA